MLFKVLIVALGAFSVVSADIISITKNMRKTLEWLHNNSEHDKNSTMILAMAAGSMDKQCHTDGSIQSHVQATYLDLALAISKEKFSTTEPEVRMYFTSEQFEFVGIFSPDKVVKTNRVTDSPTIYQIFERAEEIGLFKKCSDEFYKNNLKPNDPAKECVITEECKDAMSKPSAEIGAVLRAHYVISAENLHHCTNFKDSYDSIVAGQMQEIFDEINTYMDHINKNEGKLDSRLRYTFLRLVIMMLSSGYDIFSSRIEDYVKSLYHPEGYCGVAEDIDIDKVVLSAQCYAFWTFKRQILLEEMKKSQN